MKNKKTTIRDIAQKADISTAAVSMILSGKKLQRFTEETIQHVLAVAKELNYTKGKSGRIILEVAPTVFNPYYSTIIQGMDMEAIENNFTTMLFNTYWDQDREKQVLQLVEQNPLICGVIFAMIPQAHETALELNKKVPVVAIGDYNEDLQIDGVDINNFTAGRLIGEHLAQLGHKHIAFISTGLNSQHTARTRRLDGLRAVCAEHADMDDIMVYSRNIDSQYELQNVNVEYETGYTLAQECIQKNPDITALVATNDMVAYGIINAIVDAGFKIPQDYSVCGFDNIFPSKFSGIALTSVEHSIIQRGKKAVNLLLSRVGDIQNEENVTRVEYRSSLILRNSTSKPRA